MVEVGGKAEEGEAPELEGEEQLLGGGRSGLRFGEVAEEIHGEGEDLGLGLADREGLPDEFEGDRRDRHAREVREDRRKALLHPGLGDSPDIAATEAHLGLDQSVGLEGSAEAFLAAAGAAREDGDLAVLGS